MTQPSEPMEPIQPRRTALLLMDLQAGIVSSLADPDALLAPATAAVSAARAAGAHIGHVRVAFTPAERATIPARNKTFRALAGSGRFTEGTPEAGHHPALAPADDDIQVRKTRVGAFSTTDLAAQLDRRGIDTLVLTGVATSGVVLSTIREAADRDYRLLVLADVCADRDDEVHRVLIEKVFPRQADVRTAAAFAATLTA